MSSDIGRERKGARSARWSCPLLAGKARRVNSDKLQYNAIHFSLVLTPSLSLSLSFISFPSSHFSLLRYESFISNSVSDFRWGLDISIFVKSLFLRQYMIDSLVICDKFLNAKYGRRMTLTYRRVCWVGQVVLVSKCNRRTGNTCKHFFEEKVRRYRH